MLNLSPIENIEYIVTDETAKPIAELLRDSPSLHIQATSPNVYSAIGLHLKKMGQFELAINYYTLGIELAPNNLQTTRLYARRANAYSDGSNNLQKALEDAQKGWRLSHETCRYCGLTLITVYTRQKKPSECLEIAKKLYNLDSQDPLNIYNLASSLSDYPSDLKDFETAEHLYKAYLRGSPNDADALAGIKRLESKKATWLRNHQN